MSVTTSENNEFLGKFVDCLIGDSTSVINVYIKSIHRKSRPKYDLEWDFSMAKWEYSRFYESAYQIVKSKLPTKSNYERNNLINHMFQRISSENKKRNG